MSSVTRPRGPLPSRVYWTRRAAILAVALLLVVGVAKVLGGGSDGKDPGAKAEVVAGDTTPSPDASPSATTSKGSKKHQGKKHKKPKKTVAPLPEPSGPCADGDVLVKASTDDARAGGTVPITLEFTTKESEACTFAVSPESVVLRLTSGSDKIWSSQQCPRFIPTTSVVARRTVPGTATVSWNGQRSDDECSRSAGWAMPGYYHAETAVLGGDPTDVQFRLSLPDRPTITPKPKIKKKHHQKKH